jgi:N4-gp56 family major capsid protein
MANTLSTTWDDQVKSLYDQDFKIAVGSKKVWGQHPKRKKAVGGARGNAVEFDIIERLVPQVGTLDQNNDVTPITSSDTAVSITLLEKGAAMRISKYLEATAYTNAHKAAAESIAANVIDSTELLARAAYISGTRVYRPAGVARTALAHATAAHRLDYANITNMVAIARGLEMPEVAGGGYVAIIHPSLSADLMADSNWLAVNEYAGGKGASGNMFTGEVGQLAGVRFEVSPFGKVYWGGATASHTSTTNGAILAGATSFVITTDGGYAAGDWCTVGALETVNTESVQVTSVASTPTFTIVGMGNTETNTGFKFAHDSGVAVNQAESAAACVLVGAESVGYVYSSVTGPDAKVQVTLPSMAINGRFTDFSWWLIAGWGVIANRYLLRGEFPTAFGTFGYCEPSA